MSKSSFKEEYVMINNCNHYVLHDYQNVQHDIILFVHGGPGEPSSLYASIIDDQINNLYHIIHYDQRGCGRTYFKNKKDMTNITMDVLLEDLHQMIQYIKATYKKEKIVLLGHSFGGLLASLYVLKHPEDITYYIGVSQLICFKTNEEVKLRLLKKLVTDHHNIKAKHKLKEFNNYPSDTFNETMYHQMKIIREIMVEEKLVDTIDKNIMRKIKKNPFFKWRMIPTDRKLLSNYLGLINELLSIDLNELDNNYQVGVYYLLGKQDMQTPMVIAESYYDRIQAPLTKKVIVNEAKHNLMITNHKDFVDALAKFKRHYDEFYIENKKKFYSSIAKYYQYIFPVKDQIVQILRNEFLAGRRLLDIGCADGEYAKQLFNEGFNVDGIDMNEQMIAIAKMKEQKYLSFYVKDVLDIDVKARYDGVYCIGNTLAHIVNQEDLRKALYNIYTALKVSGKFYLQILNYDRVLDQGIDSLPLISNDKVTFIRSYEKNRGRLLFNTTLICDGEKMMNSIELNPIRYSIVIQLLKEVGFVQIIANDGYTNKPFNIKTSYHLCIVAVK